MGANDQQRCTPFYTHTNPEVSACYRSFPVKQGAIISAPSYKKLVKTLNNVLPGHMLRKNPRKQMTNRDVPHFSTHKPWGFSMLQKLSSPTMCHYHAPSYQELVKTVNKVLEGHRLRKNQREQMTNRDVPHFTHNKDILKVLHYIFR